jgi:hypothetical protein
MYKSDFQVAGEETDEANGTRGIQNRKMRVKEILMRE